MLDAGHFGGREIACYKNIRGAPSLKGFDPSNFAQDLEPFIQPLMEKLGKKMQSSDVKVQKKAYRPRPLNISLTNDLI